MALEFKTIDDLKALEASSSEGIANQAQQQFKPTGDLWYDIGAGMTQGLQAYQSNRKQAYQDFKKRHEGQSFVPGEQDKEWMYKKMLREKGGMSSKDVRNQAMKMFRPKEFESQLQEKEFEAKRKEQERADNLQTLEAIKGIPKGIGEWAKGFGKNITTGVGEYISGVKEGLDETKADIGSSELAGQVNALLSNARYLKQNRDFNQQHQERIQALRDESELLQQQNIMDSFKINPSGEQLPPSQAILNMYKGNN